VYVQQIVLKDAPIGSFILRPSSQPGTVALSIKERSGTVEHALIEFINNEYRIQLTGECGARCKLCTPASIRPSKLQMSRKQLRAL
jgi:hypothetical protein